MTRVLLALALISVAGCTFTKGCYVGVSLLPPGPFIHCGLDVGEDDEDEDESE